MKRHIFLCIVFVFSGALTLAAQPKLVVSSGDTWDWGDVSFSEDTLKADITLKNTGNQVLIISNVNTSCGCTAALPDKDTLQAGESTRMYVAMSIKGRSGNTKKRITIHSNDPGNKLTTINVKANVIVPVMSEPKFLSFSNLKPGVSARGSLVLTNTSDEIILLTDVKSPKHTSVDIDTPISLEPGEKVSVTATCTPEDVGYYNTFITISTSHPDMPVVRIKGYGQVAK